MIHIHDFEVNVETYAQCITSSIFLYPLRESRIFIVDLPLD
jgi:hypothetical protein